MTPLLYTLYLFANKYHKWKSNIACCSYALAATCVTALNMAFFYTTIVGLIYIYVHTYNLHTYMYYTCNCEYIVQCSVQCLAVHVPLFLRCSSFTDVLACCVCVPYTLFFFHLLLHLYFLFFFFWLVTC